MGVAEAVPFLKILLPKYFGQQTIAFVPIALAHTLVALDFVALAPARYTLETALIPVPVARYPLEIARCPSALAHTS